MCLFGNDFTRVNLEIQDKNCQFKVNIYLYIVGQITLPGYGKFDKIANIFYGVSSWRRQKFLQGIAV